MTVHEAISEKNPANRSGSMIKKPRFSGVFSDKAWASPGMGFESPIKMR